MATKPSGLKRAGTVFDKAIGLFAPAAALRRVHTREALHRAYEAASPRDPWRPQRATASANTDHGADATVTRQKARALVQNVPYIAQGLRSRVSNTIGTGISTRSTAPNAGTIDALWTEWQTHCDADGRLTWPALQAVAYRAMLQDGECLVRLRPRRIGDDLAVPLQLQLLEIDWLDSSKVGTPSGGGAIINGIQYDALGAVLGYWLFDQHPGEISSVWSSLRTSASTFVPANRIIHLFNAERPGQGRGFSALASIVARVRDMMLFEDAELARKNTESRLAVLVSGNPDALRNEDASPTNGRDLGTLGSGSVIGMPEGSTITTVQPKAAGGYVEYLKFNLHLVAVGMGVTYEMLTGDASQGSFSSTRMNVIEFRRNAEAEQWNLIIPKLIEPVWRAFVQAAFDAGKVSKPAADCDHSTPRWEYIDPKDDASSDQLQIATGLTSLSETLRRRGYKPEQVFAEIKADHDRLDRDGTLGWLMMLQARQAPQMVLASAAPQAQK